MFRCQTCREFGFEEIICGKCVNDMKEIIKQVKEFIENECKKCELETSNSDMNSKCRDESGKSSCFVRKLKDIKVLANWNYK